MRPFTCRKLKIMADAKRGHDFDVAISHVSFISQMLAGEFDPIKSNPYKDNSVPPILRTEKRRQKEADNGIKAIGMMLRQMQKPKKKKK